MKTIKLKIYEFSELSESAKDHVLEEMRNFLVEDSCWWNWIYEDAEEIGVKIEEFDLSRMHIGISCILSHDDIARKIIVSHGLICGTHVAAKKYLSDRKLLKKRYNDADEEKYADEMKYIECDFEEEIKYQYLNYLKDGYEYMTSDIAIIEIIEANDYMFYEDGTLFYQGEEK